MERVDPAWVGALARIPDQHVDAIAGRWIDLVEEELGFLPREEKPWIRKLAGRCRRVRPVGRPLPGRAVRLVASDPGRLTTR